METEFESTTEIFFSKGEPLGLRLHSVFIPILSIIAIILNSIVVYSSGLLLEMRKFDVLR